MPKRRYFAGTPSADIGKEQQQMPAQEATVDQEFLDLIKDGRYGEAIAVMPRVVDINMIDPTSGFNALHMAAARPAKILLEALWTRADLEETKLDARNYPASELAWNLGRDQELGLTLMQREDAYARAHGQPLWRGPHDPGLE